MLIYVCSSSHGFGHAARDVAVLQQIHRLRPRWRLILSSLVPLRFLRTLLGSVSVEIRSCRWDVGMIQADALGSDQAGTLLALEVLAQQLPAQIDAEVSWIQQQQEQAVVVGDIPPAAADLARRVEAPLIWLSNFGWDEIYAPFQGAFSQHAECAEQAYRCGQLLLRCPFDMGMDWGLSEQRLGLVCSEPRALTDGFVESLQSIQRPLVMVGFGGLGLTLDVDLFSAWPEHHFLMAPPLRGFNHSALCSLPNLTLLPEGLRPLDVFPFCSRHLGKPGFSTFCEAIVQGVGLHVVERRDFAEVEALMHGLRQHADHRVLTRSALNRGDWQLDQPLLPAAQTPLPEGGAQQAAEAIIALAESI